MALGLAARSLSPPRWKAMSTEISQSQEWMQSRKRLLVLSAAAIFGGAGLLNLIEASVPGGPVLSLDPGLAAIAFSLLIFLIGERLPVWLLAVLGPVGATMIAVAIATTNGPGDGAILYLLPVLWESYFFGRRGAIAIVLWVAIAHGVTVLSMPAGEAYFDRWLDVVMVATVVAAVVELLSMRNRRLLDRLAAEAKIDNLTGLLNRRGFTERAMAEIARARRELGWIGIASFDLDHFKSINDEHGHEIGDRVLVKVSRLFQGELRESDVLARMGGEEFIVLLPGDRLEEVEATAERIRDSLQASADPNVPKVTVSAGVFAARAPEDLEGLLRSADRALYEAKFAGRNRTVVHEEAPTSAPWR
jgi:diguanylate cyclase (GGDEF)-like protein